MDDDIDFSISKINDFKLKPIIRNKMLLDKKNIIGGELFQPFSNLFLLAKKMSGKTTCIYHILKNSCHKSTKVIFFVSTIHIDDSYKKIMEMLDKKHIEYETYNSFIDDTTGDDILQGLCDELKNPELPDEKDSDEESEEEVKVIRGGIDFGYTRKRKKKKEKKKKPEKLYSKIIVVVDDMGSSSRHPAIANLAKVNRHSKLRLIVSSQYFSDVLPSFWKNCDYACVFKSLTQEKIETLHGHLDIGTLTPQQFYELYQATTEEPFSFLYIDARKEKFRKCFDTEIKIIKKK